MSQNTPQLFPYLDNVSLASILSLIKLNTNDIGRLALGTMEALNGKADKSTSVDFTIPTTGWKNSNLDIYVKYYDLAAPGVTSSDIVEVNPAPASQNIASQCGLCPTNESRDGSIRLWAMNIPSAAITGSYRIIKTKEEA